MAATIEPTLVKDPKLWLQRSYAACDEMISRGNLVAKQIKSELQQLEDILARFSPDGNGKTVNIARQSGLGTSELQQERTVPSTSLESHRTISSAVFPPNMPSFEPLQEDFTMEDLNWQDGMSAEQLMSFAESMDLSALDWLSVGSS